MGISSNQARFLALTSRQVDLERRIQQICQRRLRLTSELENLATSYNNQISNRQLYLSDTSGGINNLTVTGINSMKDENGNPYFLVMDIGGTDSIQVSMHADGLIGYASASSHILSFEDYGLDTSATESERIAAALKAGDLYLAKYADSFTQDAVNLYDWFGIANVPTGPDYAYFETVDWRTVPGITDELYKGDDVDAETKYESTVEQINAQDKKLQLEQTSIEVEYKAISSEKESVKKVLDTNAQGSFKYFS